MAKEQFFYPAAAALFKGLEGLSQRSGVSRGQAFEDWLTAMACALAAETKEEEYLAMIERHKSGLPGKRGADLMARMFAELVAAMSETDDDILGDLYQGAITYGEAGQYFTPQPIAELMARLAIDAEPPTTTGGSPRYVHDPACGTGRMLLAASRIDPNVEIVGVDVDARCAKITAINLGLRSQYGWVVCGNSLSLRMTFAYRIAPFFHESPAGLRRGVLRDAPVDAAPVLQLADATRDQTRALFSGPEAESVSSPPADAPRPSSFNPPAIVEIPRWALQLDQLAASAETSEDLKPPTSEPSSSHAAIDSNAPSSSCNTPPIVDTPSRSQGRLF